VLSEKVSAISEEIGPPRTVRQVSTRRSGLRNAERVAKAELGY